jgi:hypothetical protein
VAVRLESGDSFAGVTPTAPQGLVILDTNYWSLICFWPCENWACLPAAAQLCFARCKGELSGRTACKLPG